jgi:hypothetical protein
MPALNQKGPMGEGPMTGRKMGRCTNFGVIPKNQNLSEDRNQDQPDDFGGWGRGRSGRGRGRGMGLRNRFRGDF